MNRRAAQPKRQKHVPAPAPPDVRLTVARERWPLPPPEDRAYDIITRSVYPGFFWMSCALFVATAPGEFKRKHYIMGLSFVRFIDDEAAARHAEMIARGKVRGAR